jgi:uncharacterized protein (DUF302 family)
MSATSKLGLIALSMAGGAIGVVVGIKVLATRYGLMKQMMFTVRKSKLDFEETITAIRESAVKNGWEVPSDFDIQQQYIKAGLEDMTRVKIIYFCFPHGGYRILKDDTDKPMSVIMPAGVSVYEATDGQVYIAGINFDRMSGMFSGTVREVLKEAAGNYANTLRDIAEESEDSLGLSRMPARMMAWMMDTCFSFMDRERRESMLGHCRGMLDQMEAKYLSEKA